MLLQTILSPCSRYRKKRLQEGFFSQLFGVNPPFRKRRGLSGRALSIPACRMPILPSLAIPMPVSLCSQDFIRLNQQLFLIFLLYPAFGNAVLNRSVVFFGIKSLKLFCYRAVYQFFVCGNEEMRSSLLRALQLKCIGLIDMIFQD